MNDAIMQKILRAIIPLTILAAAAGLAALLVTTRPKAEKRPKAELVLAVDVVSLAPTSVVVQVEGMGTVLPAQKVELLPEVGGKLVWANPSWKPGGLLKKGDELLKIDPREYELVAAQQKALVVKAEYELEQEVSRKGIAEREWALLEGEIEVNEAGRALALREPQLRNAQAALESARAGLDRALLNLERTVLRAPFNALILDRMADEGQVVGVQTRLATLVGTDEYWVQVSLPMAELRWITLPDEQGRGGAQAQVFLDAGRQGERVRTGRVIRVLGDLDNAGRMARLLVSVPDPLQGGEDSAASAFPLNAYVRVLIQGPMLEDSFVLPRSSLHEGRQLWVMSEEDRLDIHEVDVGWQDKERMVVSGPGMKAGTRVVTSRIPLPIKGMKLKIIGASAPDQEKSRP